MHSEYTWSSLLVCSYNQSSSDRFSSKGNNLTRLHGCAGWFECSVYVHAIGHLFSSPGWSPDCTTPGVGVGVVVDGSVDVSKMLFYVKVFYVMDKALPGELSWSCDRSCFTVTWFQLNIFMSTIKVIRGGNITVWKFSIGMFYVSVRATV